MSQILSENLFVTGHPNLIPPSHPERKIWRYMSLGRYVTLLRQRQLFFASVASLDDRWEGEGSRCSHYSQPGPARGHWTMRPD